MVIFFLVLIILYNFNWKIFIMFDLWYLILCNVHVCSFKSPLVNIDFVMQVLYENNFNYLFCLYVYLFISRQFHVKIVDLIYVNVYFFVYLFIKLILQNLKPFIIYIWILQQKLFETENLSKIQVKNFTLLKFLLYIVVIYFAFIFWECFCNHKKKSFFI